jgi:hypothetical protein
LLDEQEMEMFFNAPGSNDNWADKGIVTLFIDL